MDLNDLKYLSDGSKEVYNALTRMFESEHWKAVVHWADTNAKEQVERIVNAQTWDVNRLATGERAAFLKIVHLEATTENEFLSLVDQAREQETLKVEDSYE